MTSPDPDAFEELAAARLGRAYRLAGLILGNGLDAEDVVQEALIKAWHGWPRLRDCAVFDSWFDHIVINACRDHLRRMRVVQRIAFGSDPVEPEDPFARALNADSLGRALLTLTVEQRTVVVLRYWADLSHDEIAARLALPTGTVKSRLNHARSALRRKIDDAAQEDGQ